MLDAYYQAFSESISTSFFSLILHFKTWSQMDGFWSRIVSHQEVFSQRCLQNESLFGFEYDSN